MHTLATGERVRIYHHGDYEGDVYITTFDPETDEPRGSVKIQASDLEEFFVEKTRSTLIGKLEQMESQSILAMVAPKRERRYFIMRHSLRDSIISDMITLSILVLAVWASSGANSGFWNTISLFMLCFWLFNIKGNYDKNRKIFHSAEHLKKWLEKHEEQQS